MSGGNQGDGELYENFPQKLTNVDDLKVDLRSALTEPPRPAENRIHRRSSFLGLYLRDSEIHNALMCIEAEKPTCKETHTPVRGGDRSSSSSVDLAADNLELFDNLKKMMKLNRKLRHELKEIQSERQRDLAMWKHKEGALQSSQRRLQVELEAGTSELAKVDEEKMSTVNRLTLDMELLLNQREGDAHELTEQLQRLKLGEGPEKVSHSPLIAFKRVIKSKHNRSGRATAA